MLQEFGFLGPTSILILIILITILIRMIIFHIIASICINRPQLLSIVSRFLTNWQFPYIGADNSVEPNML